MYKSTLSSARITMNRIRKSLLLNSGFALFILLIFIVNTGVAMDDIVINNVDIVDVDNTKIIEHGQIVMTAGKIKYAGIMQPTPIDAKEVIDGSSLIALPGFINTHTHLWQHIAKGFYPNGNLQQWVRIYKYAHYFTEDELYTATFAAASQALLSGITTVSDFASVNYSEFSLDATCKALTDAGLGGVVIWWNPAAFLPSKIKSEEIPLLNKRYKNFDIWMGQGPLSFFGLPAIYDGIKIAEKLNMGISEHTMENVQEQRDVYERLAGYLDRYGQQLADNDKAFLNETLKPGKPSNVDGVRWIRRLAKQIMNDPENKDKLTKEEIDELKPWIERTSISQGPILDYLGAFNLINKYLSIHSVWQNSKDIKLYNEKDVSISHNPGSNMYLSSGIAPILEYKANNVTVSIGTDGAASNDGIDFFRAMRSAFNLQKLSYLDATYVANNMDSWFVIKAATINGAKALGKEDEIGSIKAGKEADITLLSKKRLGLSPLVRNDQINNLIPLLVYSANIRTVKTVIADGQVVVKNAKLTRHNVDELSQQLSIVSNDLVERASAGKKWIENIDIANIKTDINWHKFRSVRKKDLIDITVTNTSESPRQIQVSMSGQTFGGASASMLSAETLKRFPIEDSKNWWSKKITLNKGDNVILKKPANTYEYTITLPNISRPEKRQGSAEQLLLLVRKSE